jgi:hypothetical protein
MPLLFDSGSHNYIFHGERQFFLGALILFFEYSKLLLLGDCLCSFLVELPVGSGFRFRLY